MKIHNVNTRQDALEILKQKSYDCLVIDYMLPDIGGMDFVVRIKYLKKAKMSPVLIYSAKDFSPKEKTQLKQYANRILLKDVNSVDLLLEEVVMHLHINHKDLQPEKQMIIENLRSREDVLANK